MGGGGKLFRIAHMGLRVLKLSEENCFSTKILMGRLKVDGQTSDGTAKLHCRFTIEPLNEFTLTVDDYSAESRMLSSLTTIWYILFVQR